MSHPPGGTSSNLVRKRMAGHAAVFGLAALATVGIYAGLENWLEPGSLLQRYLAGHWVEYVETGLFIWALLVQAMKGWQQRAEQRAARRDLLPAWSGQAVPAREAIQLLAALDRQPAGTAVSMAARRLRSGLEFVANRGSAQGLDEYLRAQSDADANAVDGGYSLIRFITWAIPILGFLGTVLGITEAIANVTPEQLARSITGVTDGLAVAFDTTAIALIYSMVLMFLSYVIDRRDQALLAAVDDLAEQRLAHRFDRQDPRAGDIVELVRSGQQELAAATERLVGRQAELWARSMDAVQARLEERDRNVYERFAAALAKGLDATLAAHHQRLVALEQQTEEGLARLGGLIERVGQRLEENARALEQQQIRSQEAAAGLASLLDGERNILRLQETLAQNLHLLAQAGSFQEAVHSLAAAIHLLTARVETAPGGAAYSSLVPRKDRAA